jgi:uroporphyrinogen III methyltransferase/synthase
MEKPLDGVKVVVTRAKGQAESFASLLEDRGAKVILFPTIEFKEPDDLTAIDDALNRLSDDKTAFDWIIFTSANGVKFFFKRLNELKKDGSVLSSLRIGVVGPKTADSLKKRGVEIDLVPPDYRAEGLIKELIDAGISGKKVLIPRALVGRCILPDTLRSYGADVTMAPVYETVTPKTADKTYLINTVLNDGDIILTFTSGSTAKNFFALFTKEEVNGFIDKVKIAVISPVTGEIINELGYDVDIVPNTYTTDDLADEIGRQKLGWISSLI